MWAMIGSAALGIWLMLAPYVLGYGQPAANVDLILGPLVATVGCVSIWELNRGLRWLNVLFGAALPIAAILLGHPAPALLNGIAVGVALIALTLTARANAAPRYGGGWSSLWRSQG